MSGCVHICICQLYMRHCVCIYIYIYRQSTHGMRVRFQPSRPGLGLLCGNNVTFRMERDVAQHVMLFGFAMGHSALHDLGTV